MDKLLVVVDASGVDELLMFVPEHYAETEIEQICYKQGMVEPVIHEIALLDEQPEQLRVAGAQVYREYWG